jgi:hypothetical protein
MGVRSSNITFSFLVFLPGKIGRQRAKITNNIELRLEAQGTRFKAQGLISFG